jgi:hypothetical protein
MNKIYNKNMVLSLGILAVLTFGAIAMPAKVSAQGGTNYIFQTQMPTPIVYSNTTIVSKPKSTAVVAKKAPAKSATSASSQTANAISATNGFTPSGIVAWILFAILILIVIIIARKVFGSDKKYQESPMKHA